MYDTALELYSNFLETYHDEYNELSDDKRNKMNPKYDPKFYFLKDMKKNRLIKKNL